MLHKISFTLIVRLAILSFGVSQSVSAQDSDIEDSDPKTAAFAQNTDATVDSKKRLIEQSKLQVSAPDLSDLEEVVVVAQRVEGSGGRRNVAVGREQLDQSDQTSMEGFFDDIDGLSTLGSDNEGNAFSINGLSAGLSNVTLNGQSIGQGRGSGGLGAGDLPPDMVRRVNLYKTPTASMEEGGAGGSVNLQLRNPVDITAKSASVKGRLAYVPDKNTTSPSASFYVGGPSESKKFGYMLSLSLSSQPREYGRQDVSNWVLEDFEGKPAYIPSQLRNNAVGDQNNRAFAGLTLGFRPHRSLDIGARLFLSQKQRESETHSLQHRIERQRNISILDFDGRIASELESSDRNRRNLRIVGSTREDQTDSVLLGVDLNWRRKSWRIDGNLGYNTDDSSYDSPSQSVVFEANSAFGYKAASDGSLIMSYADGFPPNSDFTASRINLSDRQTEDTNLFGGVDVTRQLRNSFFRRVVFGGKLRETTRSRHSSIGRLKLDEDLSLVDVFDGQYQQTPWDMSEWPAADMTSINELVQDNEINWVENLLNKYEIERRSSAGYLQADFRTNQTKKRFLIGNIGARIVGTDTWIDGYQESDGTLQPVSIKTSYTDFLPSFSMRMRVAERAALTFGAASVMTQPAFNDLAPGIRFNYGDKTARAGNPNLEPFRADQYLVELTWAPVRGRRFTGNLTYRDVESYFAKGEETLEFDDETFLVTRPVNGEDGYILSVSIGLDQNLQRLSRRLRNFALSIFYTRNKSGTQMRDPYSGEELPMPDTAAHVAKLNLSYSNNRYSGRLSYQWRGESLKASVSESGLSVWSQPVGSLNLNLGWRPNKMLQLSIDGRNLLNEEQIQTTDYSGQLWRITERDRSVALTLRAKW